MTDEQYFFALLIFIYFLECFKSVDVKEIYVSPSKLYCASRWFLKYGRSIIYLPPFLYSKCYRSENEIISLSPEGIANINTQEYPFLMPLIGKYSFIRWDNIRNIEKTNSSLFINGNFFVKCISIHQANRYFALLDSLLRSDANLRKSKIRKYLKERNDVRRIKRKIKDLKWNLLGTKLFSIIHFLSLFLAIPLIVGYSNIEFVFAIVGGLLVSIYCLFNLCIILGKEIHNNLKILVKCFFMFPFISIYSREIYANLLDEFNPYAILLAINPGKNSFIHINSYMRNLKYPVWRMQVSSEIVECCNYFNNELILQLKELLKEANAEKSFFFYGRTCKLG